VTFNGGATLDDTVGEPEGDVEGDAVAEDEVGEDADVAGGVDAAGSAGSDVAGVEVQASPAATRGIEASRVRVRMRPTLVPRQASVGVRRCARGQGRCRP
jgi:hypothetical protein